MKDFLKDVTGASGEQWFGFIALSFIAVMLTIVIFATIQDHEVECQYLEAYGDGGVIHYRIMNQVNWMFDTKAFSSVNQEETLSLFDSIVTKCPVK